MPEESKHEIEYWWRQWMQPTILFVIFGVLGSAYAAVLLQRERIERLEHRISVIEQDYMRKEVQREQLDAILHRLSAIEVALKAR